MGTSFEGMLPVTKLFEATPTALAGSMAQALAADPGPRQGVLCPTQDLEVAFRRACNARDFNLLDARNLDLYERRDIGGVIGHLRIVSNSRFDALLDRAQSLFPLLDHTLLKELRTLSEDASAVFEAFMQRSGYLDSAIKAGQAPLVDALGRLGRYLHEFAENNPSGKGLAAFMTDWETYRLTDGGAGEAARLHTPTSLKGLRLETIAILLPAGPGAEWKQWIHAATEHASERVYFATFGTPVELGADS